MKPEKPQEKAEVIKALSDRSYQLKFENDTTRRPDIAPCTVLTRATCHHQNRLPTDTGWRRGSVVRTSVCSWRTFPDLRLIHG